MIDKIRSIKDVGFLKDDEIKQLSYLDKKMIVTNAMLVIHDLANKSDFPYKKEKDIWSYNNIDFDKIWSYLQSKCE